MSRPTLAQEYWDAYQRSLAPPSGSAARNLARIRQRVRDGEPLDERSSDPEPSRRAAAGLVLFGKSASASVAIATATLLSIKLAVVGWTQLGAPSDPPAAEVESTAPSSTRRSSAEPSLAPAAPVVDPAPVAEPDPVEPPTVAAPEPARRAHRPQTAPAGAADRLRAEVLLMDEARAALERDDAAALWQMMQQHARRFPSGALTEERMAWQAVAACRLGHADAASRAAEFLRSHGRSAQATKVRRACDGLPVER